MNVEKILRQHAKQLATELEDPDKYICVMIVIERAKNDADKSLGHLLSNVDTETLVRLLRKEADLLEGRVVLGHA